MHARLFVALAAAALLFGVAAPATRADTTPMADIYAALRMHDLATYSGSTFFTSGDQVYFTYNLVNTSSSTLTVPVNTDYGTPFYIVGIEQTWVLRLGPDPTIPSMWWAGRDGDRYAAGGEILALGGPTVAPGQAIPRLTALYTTGFPPGHYRYFIEYKREFADGGTVIQTVSIDVANTTEPLDTTPPTLSVPSRVVADATSSTGAAVSYTVSAADDTDPAPTVACAPASGSSFPIGDTTVGCSASDSSGNTTTASFVVHVNGAAEQLTALRLVAAAVGPGSSLSSKVAAAQQYVAAGDAADACSVLQAFANELAAQTGKAVMSGDASALGTAAARIRNVLGC